MKKNLIFLFLSLMVLSINAQEDVHQKFARRIAEIEQEMADYRAMSMQANENVINNLDGKAWWLTSYNDLTTYIVRYFRHAPDPKVAARAYFVRAILLGDIEIMFPGDDLIYLVFPRIYPSCESIGSFNAFPALRKLAEKDMDIYLQYHPNDKNALAFKYYLGDTLRRGYMPE